MLVPATLDAALIVTVLVFERLFLARFSAANLSSRSICIYVLAFFIFAVEEELYSDSGRTALAEAGALIRTTVWASFLVVLSTLPSLFRIEALSVIAFGGSNSLLIAARWAWRILGRRHDSARNVLIIGSGENAQRIANAIQREGSGTRSLKGFMAEKHLRNIYGSSMLRRIAREEFVDELIIASSDPAIARIATEEGRRNALDVRFAPEIGIAARAGEIAFENLGGIPLLKIQECRSREYELAVKRTLDIVGALLGLIVLAPMMVLIAALIKMDSRGPVFYRAPRTGRKGRQFVCYKFRTMVPEADTIKSGLRSRNERDGAFFKIADDPRVTRIGRFLRRYSLDELPQLWNVLLGDMSLVGPRPHPPDDVSLYQVHHLQRLDFVPGITGLWQVRARQDSSFERSVALDVEYIKSWNLRLDARILWQTIFVVLEGSGS